MAVQPSRLWYRRSEITFLTKMAAPSKVCNLWVILDSTLSFESHNSWIRLASLKNNFGLHSPTLWQKPSFMHLPPIWTTIMKSCPGYPAKAKTISSILSCQGSHPLKHHPNPHPPSLTPIQVLHQLQTPPWHLQNPACPYSSVPLWPLFPKYPVCKNDISKAL